MDGNLALYETPRLISNKYKTEYDETIKVGFYTRVSSAHEMQLQSFDNQLIWCDALLQQHKNWQKVDIYTDRGITGTVAKKRPGFMRMIQDAFEGKVQLLVVRELSRFSRNIVDACSYVRKLKKVGVEVYFVNDNLWTFENDSDFKLGLYSSISEDESRHTSQRVKSGQAISRRTGVLYGNGNVLGYRLKRGFKSIDNTYEIIEEDAETIRLIYKMYIEQEMGAKAIASELQRLGRKNASGIVKWSADRILRALSNKCYCGYICYNKSYTTDFLEHTRKCVKDESKHIYIKGNFPAIISEDIFNKAQAIRYKKRRRVGDDRAIGKCMSHDKWGRKLVCSCGNSFKRFNWRTNKNGETYYGYTCYNIVNNKSKSFREANNLDTEGYCDVQSICDWKLDLMIKTILKRLWSNPKDSVKVLVEQIADNYTEDNCILDVDKAKLLRERSRVNTRLEALLDMRLDGSITNEAFNIKQTQLKERLEQIEAEIKTNEEVVVVEKTEDVRGAISKVTEVLEKMCDLDQKQVDEELVDSLIRRITPTEDGVYKWYFKGENDEEESTFAEENYILYDSFVIDFDTARAFRKSHGNYLRKNQYQNLNVEVYVRK